MFTIENSTMSILVLVIKAKEQRLSAISIAIKCMKTDAY